MLDSFDWAALVPESHLARLSGTSSTPLPYPEGLRGCQSIYNHIYEPLHAKGGQDEPKELARHPFLTLFNATDRQSCGLRTMKWQFYAP